MFIIGTIPIIFVINDIQEVFSSTIIGGFIKLISSLKWDYTYILTIFAEFPFRLTSYNGDGYAFSIVISLIILCKPIWSKIMSYDYGKNYYSYMQGGFSGEIINQIKTTGIILCVIMLIAIIYGLIKRTELILSFECLIAIIIAVFMFTRIQNMGSHQTLLLVPYYIILTIIGTAFLFNLRYKNLIHLFLFVYITLTLISNYTGHTLNMGNLLSNQDNVVYDREDYDEIKNLSNWLLNNTGDDKVYIIPHSYDYNPDVFRNVFLPNQKLRNKIPYGSGVMGTHWFPTELLDNAYVLTCAPFSANERTATLTETFNKQFLLNIKKFNNFKLIKKFNMGNGTEFILYKRIKKCSLDEAKSYINVLPPETKDFPNLYEKYILNYISEYNLKN